VTVETIETIKSRPKAAKVVDRGNRYFIAAIVKRIVKAAFAIRWNVLLAVMQSTRQPVAMTKKNAVPSEMFMTVP